MAFLYDQGKYGVKRDKKKAEEMHRKAGAAGYAPSASRFGAAWPDAARVLGLTAAEAREQSRTRRRAAAEGYASEQYNLGVMYQTGFRPAQGHDQSPGMVPESGGPGRRAGQKHPEKTPVTLFPIHDHHELIRTTTRSLP